MCYSHKIICLFWTLLSLSFKHTRYETKFVHPNLLGYRSRDTIKLCISFNKWSIQRIVTLNAFFLLKVKNIVYPNAIIFLLKQVNISSILINFIWIKKFIRFFEILFSTPYTLSNKCHGQIFALTKSRPWHLCLLISDAVSRRVRVVSRFAERLETR